MNQLQNSLQIKNLQLNLKSMSNMLNSQLPKFEKSIGAYKIEQFLSHSENGCIYQVNKDGKSYAMKILYNDEQHKLLRAQQYINLIQSLQSPHFIKTHTVFQHTYGIVIVMDLIEGGCTLSNFLEKSENNFLMQKDALKIFKGILQALIESHENNIVHRDLGPQNILIENLEKGAFLNCLRPSNTVKETHVKIEEAQVGIYYDPPEVLEKNPYYYQCDIWALGIILFYMLFGTYPFWKGSSRADQAQIIRETVDENGVFNIYKATDKVKVIQQHLNPETLDLIQRLLTIDPEKRIGYQEIINHPAFGILGEKQIELQPEIPMTVSYRLKEEQKNYKPALEEIEEQKSDPIKVIQKFQKLMKHIKLVSQTMLLKGKHTLQVEINGFKKSELQYFDLAILRYKYMNIVYANVVFFKDIELEMGLCETILFQFFMQKMMLFSIREIQNDFIDVKLKEKKDDLITFEKLEIIQKEFQDEHHHWNEQLQKSLQQFNSHFKQLFKNCDYLDKVNLEFENFTEKTQQNPNYVPESLQLPFRGSIMMCIQKLYLSACEINKITFLRPEIDEIDLPEIYKKENIVEQHSDTEGELYLVLNQINFLGQQFAVSADQLVKIPKLIEKQDKRETRNEDHVEINDQLIIGKGYQCIPPIIVGDLMKSAKLMQIALRLSICVCSNHIFNLKLGTVKFSYYQQAFKKLNLDESLQNSYLINWIGTLNYLDAKRSVQFLIAAHFPGFEKFNFDFFH